jgi:hypothetical protein
MNGTYLYVRDSEFDAYMARGWIFETWFLYPPHDEHGCLMRACECWEDGQ